MKARVSCAATPPVARRVLLLGGVRSGKSRLAERLALATGLEPWLIATAERFDEEMRARIAAHREQRDAAWTVVEEPLELAMAIAREARADRVLLVDCLTVWLGNLMHHGHDPAAACAGVVMEIDRCAGHVVLVSNEVGLGGIAANADARRFADLIGRLHQDLARVVHATALVVAGRALWLDN